MKKFSAFSSLLVFLGFGCSVSTDPGAMVGRTSQAICPQSPANAVFSHAVCICEDFSDVGQSLLLRSLPDSGATVGVNGSSTITGTMDVGGSFISYAGLTGTGRINVRDNVVSNGDVGGVGQLSVGQDLTVGGDFSNVGGLSVGGTMRVGGTSSVLGNNSVAAVGPFASAGDAPCGCDPQTFFDVSAAVAAAKVTNDNAAAGLSTINVVGRQDLTLSTGQYYFENVNTVGSNHITIDGTVALFIDGDLDAVGDEQISLLPGAVLDLYVSGSVASVGHSQRGDQGAFRLYVGGTTPVAISGVGRQTIRGLIYAPQADLSFVGNTTIEGAVFARRLNGVGRLEIDYAAVASPSPQTCSSDDSDGGIVEVGAGNPSVDAGVGVADGGESEGEIN